MKLGKQRNHYEKNNNSINKFIYDDFMCHRGFSYGKDKL